MRYYIKIIFLLLDLYYRFWEWQDKNDNNSRKEKLLHKVKNVFKVCYLTEYWEDGRGMM